MKGFFKKTKTELKRLGNKLPSEVSASSAPNQQGVKLLAHQPSYLPGMAQDQPSTIVEPTATDIIRYKYHHGTNLGSVYVLERWLHPSRFPNGASGSSELESVKAWVGKVGIEAAKRKAEDHWNNAVMDADIQWLRNEAKCKLTLSSPLLPGQSSRV